MIEGYDIYCYGNLYTILGVLNGVAEITQNNGFLGMIKFVAIIGMIGAMVLGFLSPGRMATNTLAWLAGFVLTYSILFIPKVGVVVIDRIGGANFPVANIPIGMALFASATSRVGNALTEWTETAMSLPDDRLKYQNNGLIFGNRLITASRASKIADPQLYQDMIDFFANCTMYDISDGTIPPADFQQATNIWELMGSTNAARFTTTGPTQEIVSCGTAYSTLTAALPAEVLRARTMLAMEMNKFKAPTCTGPPPCLTLDPVAEGAAAITDLDPNYEAAYSVYRLQSAGQLAGDLVRQNAMINLVMDAPNIIGQRMNDPSTIMLANARAQAVASTNISFINQAKLAEEAMPMIRNAIQAVMYAMFPFMILICFVATGQSLIMALKSYILMLVWIELWPPIYAVLNYVGTLTSSHNISNAANNRGFNLETAGLVYNNSISDQAVMGYLVITVPMIASALVYGGSKAASALGGASFVGSATRAAEAAGSGNINMGNIKMNTSKSFENQSPFMQTNKDAYGTSTHAVGMGGLSLVGYQNQKSSLPIDFKLSNQAQEGYDQEKARTQQAAITATEGLVRTASSGLASAISHSEKYAKSSSYTDQAALAQLGNVQRASQEAHQLGDAINETLNLGKGHTVGQDLAFAAAVYGQVGPSSPWAAGGIKADLAAKGIDATDKQIQQILGKAETFSKSTSGQVLHSFAENYGSSQAHSWVDQSDKTGSQEDKASYDKMLAAQASMQKSYQAADSAAEKAYKSHTIGVMESQQLTDFLISGGYLKEDEAKNWTSHAQLSASMDRAVTSFLNDSGNAQSLQDYVAANSELHDSLASRPTGYQNPTPGRFQEETISAPTISAPSQAVVDNQNAANQSVVNKENRAAGTNPGAVVGDHGVRAAASAGQTMALDEAQRGIDSATTGYDDATVRQSEGELKQRYEIDNNNVVTDTAKDAWGHVKEQAGGIKDIVMGDTPGIGSDPNRSPPDSASSLDPFASSVKGALTDVAENVKGEDSSKKK